MYHVNKIKIWLKSIHLIIFIIICWIITTYYFNTISLTFKYLFFVSWVLKKYIECFTNFHSETISSLNFYKEFFIVICYRTQSVLFFYLFFLIMPVRITILILSVKWLMLKKILYFFLYHNICIKYSFCFKKVDISVLLPSLPL